MRPRVIVNVAMSADGKLSTRERRQVKISGPADFSRVDRLKAESDAVMVGIGTVLADDPSLTIKSDENRLMRTAEKKNEHPIRVVVDSRARTPLTAALLTKGSGERVIAVSQKADPSRVAALQKHATVIISGDDTVDLALLLERLFEMGVGQLIVEGGGTLIAGLFAAGLVSDFYTFVGDIVIGGKDAPTPADGPGRVHEVDFTRLTLVSVSRMDDGVLVHWRVKL